MTVGRALLASSVLGMIAGEAVIQVGQGHEVRRSTLGGSISGFTPSGVGPPATPSQGQAGIGSESTADVRR